MQTLDVEYRPGDRVQHTATGASGTVLSVIAMLGGSRWFSVDFDSQAVRPLGLIYRAHELEPLVVNGQELAP